MSAQIFMLPDLGEGLTEADILEWRVAVGDTVQIDQIVAEVETAKAAVEVPVPFEGTVLELHAAPGDTLAVGSPLITISGSTPTANTGTDSATESAAHEKYRDEERAGSGNVLIGYGTGHDSRPRRRRTRAVADPGKRASSHSPQAATSAPRVISPVVRELANRGGVDLTGIHGTGPGTIILRHDVEQAIAAAIPITPSETARAAPTRFESTRIPLKGLRKVVAEKLSVSRREIPDATTWVDVDATELLRARRTINTALPREDQLSLLALLARLTLAALARFPELNASVDTERGEIVRHGHVNLGVAAQTPRGLVVPVLPRADTLTTVELARQLRETVDTARAGKLTPDRLGGGTFTLNNYGVFGVDGSTPIINHPEAAILGIGRILDRAWVIDGEVTVRKITQISLSFDHRVCDGGAAGGFLRAFGDLIENPASALGWL